MLDRLRHLIQCNFGTFRGFIRFLLGEAEYLLGSAAPFLREDLSDVRRLVFVCLGNINRSAYAQAIAIERNLNSISFGLSTSTGAPAFHRAVGTAAHFGNDLSNHAALDMSDFKPLEGDLFLVMELRHARQLERSGIARRDIALLGAWASPRRLHLHDPYKCDPAYFRTCFTLIRSAVCNLAAHLEVQGSPAAPGGTKMAGTVPTVQALPDISVN